jgi:hypothetical protein
MPLANEKASAANRHRSLRSGHVAPEHAGLRLKPDGGAVFKGLFHRHPHRVISASGFPNFPRSALIVVSPDAEQQINHELIEALVRQRA